MLGNWIVVFLVAAMLLTQSSLAIAIEVPLLSRAESDESGSPGLLRMFENRIRPVLVEHCYECHSVETEAAGGLLLDSSDRLRTGGDSGPAISIGNADQSLLIRAIGYGDPSLQMPPTGKLEDSVIADFRNWIDQGALDPRTANSVAGSQSASSVDISLSVTHRAADHWSYQPIPTASSMQYSMELPPGRVIDALIDRQLASHGLKATEPALPEALVRRLYFDLTGLPPTPQQLRSSVEEVETGQLDRLVDRLLASSHYGEAMARRWMDLARYGDSITLRGFILPQAWRYRDYLISSFNEDRSYAALIREQIAGDLMHSEDLEERTQQLVATGFLALGNTNLEKQDKLQLDMDYLDEQLDVLGSVFLAQTIGCARCHDHKFDPISIRDYYAIAGILRSSTGMHHANVSEWIEKELPLDDPQRIHFEQLGSQQQELTERMKQFKLRLNSLQRPPESIPLESLPGFVIDNAQAKLVGKWVSSTHVRPLIGEDYIHDGNERHGEKSATFEPIMLEPGNYEVRLAYQPGGNRSSRVVVKVFSADGDAELLIDQRKRPPEQGLWMSLGRYRFELGGQAYVLVSNADADGHVVLDAVQFLPIEVEKPPSSAEINVVAIANAVVQTEETKREVQRLYRSIQEVEKQLSSIDSELKKRPTYLTILESGSPTDLAVHIRGNVHLLGEIIPRGFLTAVKLPSCGGADCGGGRAEGVNIDSLSPSRLDLANWIADGGNPLTARVYANRVWLWFMGRGLVDTPNNFGTTGDKPTHPELLDWLAVRLIRSGYSTKSLIREIVFSHAYQRAFDIADDWALQTDPDNHFYWRGQMRRLTVESMRDAMLCVSGELDLTIGGSIIRTSTANDFNYQHETTRRSIYHPVFRNSLPELFEQFDFADPSVSLGKRARSTYALQGLTLSNNPWVIERSQEAARQWSHRASRVGLSPAVSELLIFCLGREPTIEELQLSLDFVSESRSDDSCDLASWEALIQSLFSSIDFRFLE